MGRMKIFTLVLFLVSFIFVASKVQAENNLANYGVGQIEEGVLHVSAVEASALIDRYDDIVILDVRTAKEHAEGKIRESINIDYYADNFSSQLAELSKDAVYIVHCRSGVRSGRSLAIMSELGFKDVIHLDGGILAWQSFNRVRGLNSPRLATE